MTQFGGPPLSEFLVFLINLDFFGKTNFGGKKRSALSELIIGNLHSYTQIRGRGVTMCPPPGANRVQLKIAARQRYLVFRG